jgi:hypothetical protein
MTEMPDRPDPMGYWEGDHHSEPVEWWPPLPLPVKAHAYEHATGDFHPPTGAGGFHMPHLHIIAEDWPMDRKQRAGEHIRVFHSVR